MMSSQLPIWAATGISTLAALGVFLMMLNRRLIMMKDSWFKAPVILAIAVTMTGSSAWLGSRQPGLPWMAVPAGILGLLTIGEARRFTLRWWWAGSRPRFDSQDVAMVTTTRTRVAEFEVSLPRWSGGRVRVAQITDLHVSDGLPFSYYQSVVGRVLQTRPDVVVVTGDLVSELRHCHLLEAMLTPLSDVPTYAILGNHDYWAGAEVVAASVRAAGIDLIANDVRRVESAGGTLAFSGCEDPWNPRPWTRPRTSSDEPLVVLTHTPDNIYSLRQEDVDVVFAGHNHAGQIRLPGLGSIVVPSNYGRRFDHGHFRLGGTHLFVSAGIGAVSPAFRLFCPPDIFVVDLVGKGGRAESK